MTKVKSYRKIARAKEPKKPITPIAEGEPEPKNLSGGQSKMTPLTVKKLEEAFSIGADVSAACVYADISRKTFYNWVGDDKDLLHRFEQLRERPVLKAYKRVNDSVATSDQMATWLLERKRKAEFSPRTEHTGANGSPLSPGLSEEEKAKLDEILGRNIRKDKGNR